MSERKRQLGKLARKDKQPRHQGTATKRVTASRMRAARHRKGKNDDYHR